MYRCALHGEHCGSDEGLKQACVRSDRTHKNLAITQTDRNMTLPCYNIEVAYSLPVDTADSCLFDLDAFLADYARGHEAVWVASDCNPRTGKRCNCYQFPLNNKGQQTAARFIAGLPKMFNVDEARVVRNDGETRKATIIFPYPREGLTGDAVFDALNASHPLRRAVGGCMRVMGM